MIWLDKTEADLEPATLRPDLNVKALFLATGNMLKDTDAERLMETLLKVEAEAVVDALADTLLVVVLETLTKDWQREGRATSRCSG